MHRELIFLLLLMLAIGLGSWWLSSDTTPAEVGPAFDEGERIVDYYIKDFNVTTMGDDGKPVRTLKASILRHYPDDDTTQLESPFLTIYHPQNPPWKVEAEEGWVSADGELVLLSGRVEINRVGTGQVRPVNLVTRDLRVQPKQDYAETSEKVTVISNSDRIESVGMQAWLREPSRFKFLSQTRGRYEAR